MDIDKHISIGQMPKTNRLRLEISTDLLFLLDKADKKQWFMDREWPLGLLWGTAFNPEWRCQVLFEEENPQELIKQLKDKIRRALPGLLEDDITTWQGGL